MSASVVVMVTVSERVQMLVNFLQSLAEHEPNRDIAIHMQGDPSAKQYLKDNLPEGINIVHYMHTDERVGCHSARVMLLKELLEVGEHTAFINVDDDVELIKETDWQPAVDKTTEQGVGFVLTNWVKHPNALPKAISIMDPGFYPQVFVYQGGGMAYNREVAKLMSELVVQPARYDDIWPLTAYLNGYRNYRYRGSLAVHRIMLKGGMNTYMKSEPRPLLCWDWVNYRPLLGQPVGSDYSIPMDSDLKPKAKEMHKTTRAAKGWS